MKGKKQTIDRFSMRSNRSNFKTIGESPIILEEFTEHLSNPKRNAGRCQRVTGRACEDVDQFCPKLSSDNVPFFILTWTPTIAPHPLRLRHGQRTSVII